MPNRTFYYDMIGAKRSDSDGLSAGDTVRLAYQQYDSWRIMLKENLEGTVTAFDASGATTWQGAVAQDFKHDLIYGATYAGYSGAVTSIRVDGLATAPPDAGIIILTNGADEVDYVPYTAATLNGTGDYTFTCDLTLTYTFLENDVVQVEDTPAMVRILNASVDDSASATGQIDVTINCDTNTFANAVGDDSDIAAWFELAGFNGSANRVVYLRFPLRADNTLDPSPNVSPAVGGAFYTKAECLSQFAGVAGAVDIEITDPTKGFILKDRTTAKRWRLFFDNDIFGQEEVT